MAKQGKGRQSNVLQSTKPTEEQTEEQEVAGKAKAKKKDQSNRPRYWITASHRESGAIRFLADCQTRLQAERQLASTIKGFGDLFKDFRIYRVKLYLTA